MTDFEKCTWPISFWCTKQIFHVCTHVHGIFRNLWKRIFRQLTPRWLNILPTHVFPLTLSTKLVFFGNLSTTALEKGTHRSIPRHYVGPVHLFKIIYFQAFHHVSRLSGLLHVSGISSESFGIVLCHVSKRLSLCSVHDQNYITDFFLKIRFRYENDTPSRYERNYEWQHFNVSKWHYFSFATAVLETFRF